MSNSAAYQWSYVDVEAERRRELRAQLAQEITRSRDLRGQAKALRRVHRTARVDVHVVSVASQADSGELAAALDSARRINERAEAELRRVAAGIWSVPAQEDRPAARRAGAKTVAATARPSAQEERVAQVRAAKLVEAEALLERDGPGCEPDDLPLLARRLEALRNANSVESARTLFADLGVLVERSTRRRRVAARTAALRARLLDRLEDAGPDDRRRLSAALAEAPDPAHLAREVEWAVARADTARYRSAVADTLMHVLRERDYAVGDDFADLLAGDGSVVVPFGAAAEDSGAAAVPEGYGLRVMLAEDRLTTALVRAPEVGTDDGGTTSDPGAETDGRVQRWFCEDQLPSLEDAIREQGVDLDRTSALPPGVRRTAVAPDAPWPETARAHDDRDASEDRGARERTQNRRPRKKPRPARPAYGQERQREH